MISLVLASLGRIKKRSSLLHLAGEGIGPPVGEAGLLRNLMIVMVMTMMMVTMMMLKRVISKSTTFSVLLVFFFLKYI